MGFTLLRNGSPELFIGLGASILALPTLNRINIRLMGLITLHMKDDVVNVLNDIFLKCRVIVVGCTELIVVLRSR